MKERLQARWFLFCLSEEEGDGIRKQRASRAEWLALPKSSFYNVARIVRTISRNVASKVCLGSCRDKLAVACVSAFEKLQMGCYVLRYL